MARVNVGVVGLGLGRLFVAACSNLDTVGRLVICDTDPERVAAVQAEFPTVAQGYTDLDTMLKEEALDAVHIVTPDHLHRPQVERSLAAGCHVLQTKPLATTLEDGRAIVQAADASGRVLMVAQERRFRPHVQAMKAMLDAGDLGEIIHIRADQIGDRRAHFASSPWYASAEAGRTALVGSGIHEVDLLRFLVGRPIVSVSGYSNRLGSLEFPAAKTTTALYQFAGGTIGETTISYEAHWPKAGAIGGRFRLIATNGVIVDNQVARDGQDTWQTLSNERGGTESGVRGAVQAFFSSITEGTPVAVSVRDAFASLAAAVAADESAESGQKTTPAALCF